LISQMMRKRSGNLAATGLTFSVTGLYFFFRKTEVARPGDQVIVERVGDWST